MERLTIIINRISGIVLALMIVLSIAGMVSGLNATIGLHVLADGASMDLSGANDNGTTWTADATMGKSQDTTDDYVNGYDGGTAQQNIQIAGSHSIALIHKTLGFASGMSRSVGNLRQTISYMETAFLAFTLYGILFLANTICLPRYLGRKKVPSSSITDSGNLDMLHVFDLDGVLSVKTRKIAETIDNIAFRTNLLALNAAIEAARAGEADDHFKKVVEEAHLLAVQSADAARHASELIEESVMKNDVRGNINWPEPMEHMTGNSKTAGDQHDMETSSDQEYPSLEALVLTTMLEKSQYGDDNSINMDCSSEYMYDPQESKKRYSAKCADQKGLEIALQF